PAPGKGQRSRLGGKRPPPSRRSDRMRRRDFLPLAVATAMTWNPALGDVNALRVGFIHPGPRRENQSLLYAFRDALLVSGWTDGANITILDRWAEERLEWVPGVVRELIGS